MTTAFQCANCTALFCWGCDQPVTGDDVVIKTIGSRYCEGCVGAEAVAHGLPVETIRGIRAKRSKESCEHREAEPAKGWKLKVRVNPGSPISAEFECPTHGYFAATVPRDENGDPPPEAPCPRPDAIVATYACPIHGPFDEPYTPEFVANEPLCGKRDGDDICSEVAPRVATAPRNTCGQPSPWRPSAPLTRSKLGELDKGKVMDYPPPHACLDTRPFAEGMPLHEWRAKQEAITRDVNLRRHRAAQGRTSKAFVG